MELLKNIQQSLTAPKNQFNKFGNFKYRSAEDILEAVKPLLGDGVLTLSDEVVMVGDRYYIKAAATLADGTTSMSCSAFAREPLAQKGMSESQITGSASSYARKYALNGLFCIDDAKDADTRDNSSVRQPNEHEQKVLDAICTKLPSPPGKQVDTKKVAAICFEQAGRYPSNMDGIDNVVAWLAGMNRPEIYVNATTDKQVKCAVPPYSHKNTEDIMNALADNFRQQDTANYKFNEDKFKTAVWQTFGAWPTTAESAKKIRVGIMHLDVADEI